MKTTSLKHCSKGQIPCISLSFINRASYQSSWAETSRGRGRESQRKLSCSQPRNWHAYPEHTKEQTALLTQAYKTKSQASCHQRPWKREPSPFCPVWCRREEDRYGFQENPQCWCCSINRRGEDPFRNIAHHIIREHWPVRKLLGKNSEIIKTIAVWLTLIVHIDRDEELFA